MSELIKVIVNGEPRPARIGSPLSEIIAGEKPCGGHGKCGKCKVWAKGKLSQPSEAECELLSKEELAAGIRLSCCTFAEGDAEVKSLESASEAQIVTGGKQIGFDLNPIFKQCGAAIDIGTTTLAARLYDASGNVIASVSRLNPQSEFGADVISRIEAALGGKKEALADSIRKALDEILTSLASNAKTDPKNIDAVAVTGNTVMLSLLAGEDTEPFSHAPFEAKRLFGETLTANELDLSSLSPETRVYLPPCISAFVGADTVCALLATGLCESETAMLVDIGTNGEMAIWHEGKLTVCSTAAGPAFEGVGISMGMRGAAGAIDKVVLLNGEPYPHVIGEGKAIGICGSGLVDAAACMLDCEIIDETGALDDDSFELCDGVSLTSQDIRMLQLAKSAICAGLLTLIESAGLDPEDVPLLYIAGGFGNYLNKKSAAKIGLLPISLAQNSETVGNAALEGASMMLLDASMSEKARALAEKAQTLELSTNKGFSEHFMMGMMFEEV
jgi:uncharacterized 2Fe-2S/4Fe-4S cluster protein (DUF4445 family)